MQLSRRGFLRAAIVAPVAAAMAPLAGQPATRGYIRFKAASLDTSMRGQILFMGNFIVSSPRMSRCLVGIGD